MKTNYSNKKLAKEWTLHKNLMIFYIKSITVWTAVLRKVWGISIVTSLYYECKYLPQNTNEKSYAID